MVGSHRGLHCPSSVELKLNGGVSFGSGDRRGPPDSRRGVAVRLPPILLSVLLVLGAVPPWSGKERLPLLDRSAELKATAVAVAQRRYGPLTLIGVYELTSEAPAFGGFSAVAVQGKRLLLLSDGGNWASFAIHRGRLEDARAGFLGDGPGTGWEKRDRDSESLVLDRSGRAWIAFESAGAIFRYAADFARAETMQRPAAMRRWPSNGGPESMARLPDGRFVVIAERGPKRRLPRPGLIFACDPAVPTCRPGRFGYRPPAGYDPSDAAVLPNGDLLVLTRRWRFPMRFTAKLTLVPARALRPGRIVTGREIATFDGPLGENFEGIAVAREGGHTVLWMVSDRDEPLVQRTLLAKFRIR